MSKYQIKISENVFSIYVLSEDFDYILSKEIKSGIEKAILETKCDVEKIILHLDNIRFLDTSGISLLVYIYRSVCENIVLAGCREETVTIINQLRLDKYLSVR